MHMFQKKKAKIKEKLCSECQSIFQTYSQASVQRQQQSHQHQHHHFSLLSKHAYANGTGTYNCLNFRNMSPLRTYADMSVENEMSAKDDMSTEDNMSASYHYESNLDDCSGGIDYCSGDSSGRTLSDDWMKQVDLMDTDAANAINRNWYLTNNNNNYTTPSVANVTKSSLRRQLCCGGGDLSTESSIGATYCFPSQGNSNNNNNIINRYAHPHNYHRNINNNNETEESRRQQEFNLLVGDLTRSQLETLLQVVVNKQRDSDCVLVKNRGAHVIACRLFLWPDLWTSDELKRLPMCPSVNEQVYICCNPAHWHRTPPADTIPPPYQELEMDRLNSEDRASSENLKDADTTRTVCDSTSSSQVQIPESFTTNGEDHRHHQNWCEILYSELKQRVGPKYQVKNSTVNIYYEGSGGMCLKDFLKKTMENSVEKTMENSVEKTRKKIGLGITLSQEADGVWLYNRSKADVFIHSPTLHEDHQHVTKVPPGYCLNAFDINRARTQKFVNTRSIPGGQNGPIDTFSMKISFAKGWGLNEQATYRRTDITSCECWLDILFPPR